MSEIEKVIETVIDSLDYNQRIDVLGHNSPEYKLAEIITSSNEFMDFLTDTFNVMGGGEGEIIEELTQFACEQCVLNLCESYIKEI